MHSRNSARFKPFRFIDALEPGQNSRGTRFKKEIKQSSIPFKVDSKLFRDSKNNMSMRAIDRFRRDGRGSISGVFSTTGITEPTFTGEKHMLDTPTMIAVVNCIDRKSVV